MLRFPLAKLNGVRQLTAVVTGDIERPIPTPIQDRRPSREMCESCHWKERFINYKLITHDYARADEQNSRRRVRLMVKIGGGGNGADGNQLASSGGIHYHMFSAQKVEFVARDALRQKIPWVRVTRADGSVAEYDHIDEPLTDEERETLDVQVMECVDCHSRPAHRFQAPIRSVNLALAAGELPRDLPFIKREAVRALDGKYPSAQEAMAGIEKSLTDFYRQKHPALLEQRAEDLDRSIELLRTIYRETVFPEMKADWSAHLNNIGHRDSAGCFRCHNYDLESEDGDPIFRDCKTCHLIIDQIEPEASSLEGQITYEDGRIFLHPDGDEYMENQSLCSDCHDGGFHLYQKQEEDG